MKRAAVVVSLLLAAALSSSQVRPIPPADVVPAAGPATAPVVPADFTAPTCNITAPSTGPVAGLSTVVSVTSTDALSGVKKVTFAWVYCAAVGACDQVPPNVEVQTDLVPNPDTTGSPYTSTWTFPACGPYPNDRFMIVAYCEDNGGNIVRVRVDDLRLTGRGC